MGIRDEWNKAKADNGLGNGGIAQNTKQLQLGDEAAKAYAAGDWYFTPKLNAPATHHGLSGNISDWARMIRAITEAGWNLQHWTVAQDAQGRPEAYPVFIRRQA
ncbi:hypothetical protein [Paractinoplanes atraurantiacus]|uniref:Uncharacterized protein n=1 Tax=Paractinoplanes atraurantiacus TaxID=1036182 RepID=A0A285GZU2_9ACTN|nr:hypothetical protein [Actinoplanes atraurantiacus]SNY28988.1 hypothetical protein SAMN05421748_103171 [Actinoplanes atraurantiacus]